MNYVLITKNKNSIVEGFLTNDKKTMNIPVALKGRGLAHFKKNNEVEIYPDAINVIRNNEILHSMTDIRLNEIFGKTTIEGINQKDSFTSIIIDVSDIKNMWTDNYDPKFDVWNIEV
jgi:hypothetical protein